MILPDSLAPKVRPHSSTKVGNFVVEIAFENSGLLKD